MGVRSLRPKHIERLVAVWTNGTRRYADRDGTEHSVTEVIARELRLLDNRKNGEPVPPESQSESSEGSQTDPDWDDDTAS